MILPNSEDATTFIRVVHQDGQILSVEQQQTIDVLQGSDVRDQVHDCGLTRTNRHNDDGDEVLE